LAHHRLLDVHQCLSAALKSWRGPIPLLLIAIGGTAQGRFTWDECKVKVQKIQNGTLTVASINNETIGEYINNGSVHGLHDSFPRDQYLAISYKGKSSDRKLGQCSDPTDPCPACRLSRNMRRSCSDI
jgi:hypothetical protein